MTFPRRRNRISLALLRLRSLGDGLCHAYADYEDMDCRQPDRHDGHHGDLPPTRKAAA